MPQDLALASDEHSVAPADLQQLECGLLYLVGQLGPGGLERQLVYLLQAMNRRRYKPAVAVWNFSNRDAHVPHIRSLGVPILAISTTLGRNAKLRALRRMVKEIRPEVIHSYGFYTNFAAYWASVGSGAIPIGSIRSDYTLEKTWSGPWLGSLSSLWPRHQICNNLIAIDNIAASRGPFIPRQVFFVRNGLDLNHFRSSPIPNEMRVRILGVGSLVPVKRWDRVVSAAVELKRRGLECEIRIAGDGPLRGALQSQADTLGLADRVLFLGHTDQIAKLLADSAFLVHASDSEGCPNAVMEAMACGRAVVASNVGDVPALIDDGNTGFIVPRGDSDALVDRMARLIVDRDLCVRMGQAGHSKAQKYFGLDRLLSETFAAYRVAGWRKD